MRTPRNQRVKHPRPMQLMPRDMAIIYAVYQYRILRQDQLERLFGRSKSVMQRVLVRLYQHRYLDRRFVSVLAESSPTLYVLDRRGAELLCTRLGRDDIKWYSTSKALKTEFLEHTAAINDVRIAIAQAARAANYELCTWMGENDLKAAYDRLPIRMSSGRTQLVSLIPDSYFVLKTPHGNAHFFLELDRSTETVGRFKSKIQAYLTYHQSGAYTRRYNSRNFRLLTVTLSDKRLAHLKAAAEAVDGKRQFWFTTLSAITADTVLSSPIWQVAGQSEHEALIT